MSVKGEATEVGSVPTNGLTNSNRSCGARTKAHFKKWWWLHLLVFCAVVLVIVLPIVYVGYPHIAQSDVNASTVNITQMIITDPTPNSFHLKQTQVLGVSSSYQPTIYSFLAAVSLAGAPKFAEVTIPQTTAKNGQVIHLDQDVHLTNVSAFTDYTKAVMLQANITLDIAGTPKLKLGSLPMETINYDKSVVMTSLNKLHGFNVTKFQILLPALANGTNMNGTVYIPNPSVMTITMGNLTLDLSVDGTAIGQSFMNDVVLVPGDNNLYMTSVVNQSTVLNMVANKYKTGILPITIKGNSSVYNGQELSYFSAALASNSLTVDLNIGSAL